MKYAGFLCHAGLIGLLVANSVQARDLGEGTTNQSPSKALQNSDHLYELWSGIGRLRLQSGEACSAVLLDTRDRQGLASGPAYVLTSGHCVFFQYGAARLDQAMTAQITFNYFHDTPHRQRQYAVRMARWSSMVGTDLAILELEASLASLVRAGINPLKLADHQTYQSHDVVNVGAPAGFTEKGLRLSVCAEQSSGTFIDHPGVFPLAVQNRCDLHPGSSGSPMLNRRTNAITGIVSKVSDIRNTPVTADCDLSSSCEPSRYNYSYPANFLHKCFIDGVFTSTATDCSLDTITIIVAQPWRVRSNVARTLSESGQIVLPRWDFRFVIEAPFYRYKFVRDAKDCQDPRHFNAAIHSADAYINTEIGPENGAHALCIIGVGTEQQELTSAALNNVFMRSVYLSASLPSAVVSSTAR